MKQKDYTYAADRAKSDAARNSLIPVIEKKLTGQLYVTEKINDRVCKQLDMHCGIDALWAVKNEITRVYSVGLRFLKRYDNCDTILFRYSRIDGGITECQKITAPRNGQLFPAFHFQVYYHPFDYSLVKLIVIKDEDLVEYLNSQPLHLVKMRGGNEMVRIKLSNIKHKIIE